MLLRGTKSVATAVEPASSTFTDCVEAEPVLLLTVA